MIEYDHGDQIPAVLLRSSHCGGKSLKGDGTRASKISQTLAVLGGKTARDK
jgi:hypothetical protein